MTAKDVGAEAKEFDVNERMVQTISQLRQGEISSIEDLKDVWTQTNGSLEERAAEIFEIVRDDAREWLEECKVDLDELADTGEGDNVAGNSRSNDGVQ
ncbi:hypothetical protein [Halobiforma nitratireducens]|uniref:hypothetical protein n=1 Tax=Halobiforma nitratireducens TaxID=130048 RepID=UPI001268CDF1|nr:hypothetical protein [Halobiforma nitratireducens]